MNINEILKSDYDLLCKDYKKATKKIEKQDNEIKSLKEQLEYLRSNEYLNQVKWERDINERLNNTYKLVIEKQDKDIERLNNKIDKAIEYLKENACYTDNNEFVCDLRYDNCEELLDILKGSDSNE